MKSMQALFAIIALAVVLTQAAPVAAIELIIPNLDAAPFEPLPVPVTVKGFSAVAGVELHIEYSTANLTLDSITSAYLHDATTNIAIPGKVHVVWEDYTNPITLADGTALLVMYFTLTGNASGTTAVSFVGNVELVSANGMPFSVSATSGGVNITPSDADDGRNPMPLQFELLQNFPNPFNPSTTIAYSVAKAADLQLAVFNVAGQVVDRIELGRKAPGMYTLTYLPSNLPSGIYTYRLTGDGISQSREMILIK